VKTSKLMRLYYHFFTFIIFLLMTQFVDAANSPKIEYTVSFLTPQAHYAEVEMKISNLKKKEIEIAMPVWAPGSYLIREFSKNIEGFMVSNASGESVGFKKMKKNTWQIETAGQQEITVRYRVYAFEVSVRTSFVDASHAFLSPTGVFMYIKNHLKEPSVVNIIPFKGWTKVSTGLEPIAGKPFSYYAKDYDWLFDSPIEVGNHDTFEFDAAGVRHEFAMVGGGNYNKDQLVGDVTRIVEEATSIFGENPNKRYVFIVHHYQNGGGGLEHLNSTVLGAKRNGYTDAAKYSSFLSLVAHEYFHLWHVKRLRPVALGPFDYDHENYTTDLWIGEGFTAYYDNMLIQRTKAISQHDYLQLLEADINAVSNLQGDKIQSVADASFDAWIKYYRQNENSSNSTVSYYTKGALLAAALDLSIIHHNNGERSLDNVLKNAYDDFYKKKQRGFTSEEFKLALEKELGNSLSDFYKDHVHGTRPLDYNKYLNYAGLELVERNTTSKPSLGIALNKNIITKVVRDGAAWFAGLNVNDEILAINGERVENIENYLQESKIGDTLQVMLNRDGLLHTIQVQLMEDKTKAGQIVPMKNISEKQQKVFKKWMRV
jgi:predicted metalloprotease with PDZ domain